MMTAITMNAGQQVEVGRPTACDRTSATERWDRRGSRVAIEPRLCRGHRRASSAGPGIEVDRATPGRSAPGSAGCDGGVTIVSWRRPQARAGRGDRRSPWSGRRPAVEDVVQRLAEVGPSSCSISAICGRGSPVLMASENAWTSGSMIVTAGVGRDVAGDVDDRCVWECWLTSSWANAIARSWFWLAALMYQPSTPVIGLAGPAGPAGIGATASVGRAASVVAERSRGRRG